MFEQMLVDWERSPEIRWEKTNCPLCFKPTGPTSKCYEMCDAEEGGYIDSVDSSSEKYRPRTVEYKGQLYSAFTKQCIFRRLNQWNVYINFPFAAGLVYTISSVEGIENIKILSAYRAIITVADRFDFKDVQSRVDEAFTSYVAGRKAMKDKYADTKTSGDYEIIRESVGDLLAQIDAPANEDTMSEEEARNAMYEMDDDIEDESEGDVDV
jgi:hypothetical protein